ncbi:hypothetical protein ACQEVS_31780 [Streptomyces sp. CA-181903]|uniref:hypothetical protein n=1 Tax=Streptomyces sp. CA-181903 TaxID=3240055 RepID=UPI003D8BC503
MRKRERECELCGRLGRRRRRRCRGCRTGGFEAGDAVADIAEAAVEVGALRAAARGVSALLRAFDV